MPDLRDGSLRMLVRSDLARISGGRHLSLKGFVHQILDNPGFLAIFHFRVSSWLAMRTGAARWCWLPFRILFRLAFPLVRAYCGVEVHARTAIGPGFMICHGGGAVIHNAARIGRNFTVVHGVTIGESRGRTPLIGDDVVCGAGSIVIGDVRIGDGAYVGAGAVVTKDVPPGATAVGVPARNMPRKESQS